jgi:uncharacterized protein
MPVLVNLRHLEEKTVRLDGKLPMEEFALDSRDELIQANSPLEYDLEVQQLDQSLLVQGRLRLALDCQCGRCLKKFKDVLALDPYALHVPLEGDDKAEVLNDCVDLTPYLREDILLEFPRHPLCDVECSGLPGQSSATQPESADTKTDGNASLWSELNKLKF